MTAPLLRQIAAAGARLYRTPDGGVFLDPPGSDIARLVESHSAALSALVTPGVNDADRRQVAEFLDGLYVDVVADDAAAAAAVAQLLTDAAESAVVGFDTETAARPEFLVPLPVKVTRTGSVAKHQPKTGEAGAALDPRRARVRLVQAYGGGETVYLFDMDSVAWPALKRLLHKAPAIAMHNAVFDVKMLIAGPGIEPTAKLFDTMTAMRLIDGTRPGLGDAVRGLLGWQLPKTLGPSDWHRPMLTEDQVAYAAADAVATWRLWQVQKEILGPHDRHAQRLADDLIIPTARMELAGLPFDQEMHRARIRDWEISRTEAERALTTTSKGRLLRLPTPAQVAAYIAGTLPPQALADWPRTAKSGALCVDAPTLKNDGLDVPGIAELLVVRAWSKALSTYGEGLLEHVGDDGRLRSSFLIAGASTGRFSSRNVNLQNQPKRNPLLAGFRDAFAAPAGRAIIAADYSQIELRIAAEISGDEAMRSAFASREDLHTRTARLLIGGDEPTKADRTMAKAAAFGLLYGSGVRGFQRYARAANGLELTLDEAADLIDAFFGAYPRLRDWQREQEWQTRCAGCVSTVGGRRWQFGWQAHDIGDAGGEDLEDWQLEDWLSGYRRNYALNHPIQGTAAEILGVALVYVDRALRGLDAHIGAVVHDEIVLECAADIADRVRGIVARKMTRAWLEFFPSAPWRGVVEVSVGPSWGKAA